MMPFYEVVNILAQNGLRVTFNPDWHIDPETFKNDHAFK